MREHVVELKTQPARFAGGRKLQACSIASVARKRAAIVIFTSYTLTRVALLCCPQTGKKYATIFCSSREFFRQRRYA